MSHQEEIRKIERNRISNFLLLAASESTTCNYDDAFLTLVVSKTRSDVRIEMKIHRLDRIL